jgi:hypothetical protein
MEFQRTQKSGQSNHFLHLNGLSGLSLDFAWTSSRIQSFPMDSNRISTEFRWTVRWVRRKWQGPTKVQRSLLDKQWECEVLSIGVEVVVAWTLVVGIVFCLWPWHHSVVDVVVVVVLVEERVSCHRL